MAKKIEEVKELTMEELEELCETNEFEETDEFYEEEYEKTGLITKVKGGIQKVGDKIPTKVKTGAKVVGGVVVGFGLGCLVSALKNNDDEYIDEDEDLDYIDIDVEIVDSTDEE